MAFGSGAGVAAGVVAGAAAGVVAGVAAGVVAFDTVVVVVDVLTGWMFTVVVVLDDAVVTGVEPTGDGWSAAMT